MKRALSLLLTICLLLGLLSTMAFAADGKSKDIVVLYTNDVHCGIESNIGYAGLAAYKAEMEAAYENVALVDIGDAIQGDVIGTLSKGEYLVEIMNQVGYDYATFGNHEFDYGMAPLQKAIDEAKYEYLCCNLTYTGTGTGTLSGYKPYAIAEYGDKKVAYVGVDTPETFFKSTPTYFQNAKGEYVYSFANGNNGKDLYDVVQKNVDAAKADGADYVVVLAHLGIEETSAPWRSTDLIANTTGIDVVLDGHSHTTLATQDVQNKAGETVLLSSTGSKLAAIGKLTIGADGKMTTELVTDYEVKDEAAAKFIEAIKAENQALIEKVVAKADGELSMSRADGTRAVRNRETQLGNLCADAYRAVSGADIAFVNGGGVRASIKKGDVTYGDIIAIHPYGNVMCVVQTTGQQILDALELGAKNTAATASDGENSLGESGGFLNVAGLKYTIAAGVKSTVECSPEGEFIGVNGARRVQNVQVLKNGKYVPIDPKATYSLASHNYMLKDGGDGFVMFKGDKLLQDEVMIDNQVLITYIQKNLGGVIPANYGAGEKRITVIPSAYADVEEGKWYVAAVNYVTEHKLMNGMGKGFAPAEAMSRGMLVTMLYRQAGSPEVSGKVSETFVDCKDGSWYADAVLWAAQNKVVSGYGKDFKPEKAITREEMATILYNFAVFKGAEKLTAYAISFTDTISAWAMPGVAYCAQNGLMSGVGGKRFAPKQTADRAMGAQVLMNIDKAYAAAE